MIMTRTFGSFALAGAVLLAFLLSVPAFATTGKPAEVARLVRAGQPYGAASLRFFFISAYDATLWTDAPQWSMQSPFALSLAYHFSFSADDIVARSLTEMRHDNPQLSDTTLARYHALLAAVVPSVKSGDEMTSLYTPDGTVRFFRDGAPTGQVRDPQFEQAFFGIWLSPTTSEPELRAKLLRLSS
jgi:hypothetical protein